MTELAMRLKEFLTPEQRSTLQLALAACNSWPIPDAKAADPVPATPAKVFRFEVGDVVTTCLHGGDYRRFHLRRGGECYYMNEARELEKLVRTTVQKRLPGDEDATREQIESHLATIGYRAEWPDATNYAGKPTPAKVEAVAEKVETRPVFTFERGDVVTKGNTNHFLWRDGKWAYFNNGHNFVTPVVFGGGTFRSPSEVDLTNEQVVAHLNKHGWDAKFPEDTPASDSVKGERDKFGREIIERLGGAFIVKVGVKFTVSRANGDWFSGLHVWTDDRSPMMGAIVSLEVARKELELAAASLEPIPTPSPAAVEHNPFPMGAGDVTPPGESPWEAIGKLAGEIYELKMQNKTLTADLERYRDRLAKVEGSLNKGNA